MPTTPRDRMLPERRRRLVLAAAAEFADHGFEQASLNRIIAECRMSKSSLYHVVASKAALLDLVVGDLIGSLGHQWSPPAPDDFAEDFWGRVEAMVDELAALWQTGSDFALLGRVFYVNLGVPACADLFRAVGDWLDRVLQVGREHGFVRSDLPLELQGRVALAVLRSFDEWTLTHRHELAAEDELTLARAQLAAIRRLLATTT